MEMKTYDGIEGKAREGKESGERVGESRQMQLGQQMTSLMGFKTFICVGEKR